MFLRSNETLHSPIDSKRSSLCCLCLRFTFRLLLTLSRHLQKCISSRLVGEEAEGGMDQKGLCGISERVAFYFKMGSTIKCLTTFELKGFWTRLTEINLEEKNECLIPSLGFLSKSCQLTNLLQLGAKLLVLRFFQKPLKAFVGFLQF